MEHEILLILQGMLNCVERYPDGNQNKMWFTRLIQNSLNGQNCPETDLDLIYNATTIEHILATLLAIDIKTIVKIKMVQKVIITMWEENNWDINLLNKFILDEKPTIQTNQQTTIEIPTHNTTQIHEQ